MSQPGSPSGASPATPEGRLVEAAGNLGRQSGWRGRAGRTVASVALLGAALAVVAVVVGIIRLSA
jgi:hypothetical protein